MVWVRSDLVQELGEGRSGLGAVVQRLDGHFGRRDLAGYQSMWPEVTPVGEMPRRGSEDSESGPGSVHRHGHLPGTRSLN